MRLRGLGIAAVVAGTVAAAPGWAADLVHYVHTTAKIALPRGGMIPASADVAVKYDAGDGWVTYSDTVLPKIAKSEAAEIEQTIFDPAIDGEALQLTATFGWVQQPSPMLFVMKLVPSTTGAAVAKGEPVKIVARMGGYYMVNTKTERGALVPVSVIAAAPAALATGRQVPVPAMPAGAAKAYGQSGYGTTVPRTATGDLFGKLNVAYTLNGKVLAPGSYLELSSYDDNYYYLAPIYGGGDGKIIAKAAVELVPRLNYLLSLTGKIRQATRVYKNMPDVVRDAATLEQSEIFANMNPTLNAGDEVGVNARIGDDYVVEFSQGGRPGRLGIVPVSAVEITWGDADTGQSIELPHASQSTNPAAPGYVAPRVDQTSRNWNLFEIFTACSVALGVAGGLMRRMMNATKPVGKEPSYDIPHVHFEKTATGFTLRFCRSSEAFYKVTHVLKNSGGGQKPALAALMYAGMMVVLCLFLLLWYGIESFFPTRITVGREFVHIGRRKIPRADFGGLHIAHNYEGDVRQVVFGYHFGSREVAFGGVWPAKEGLEMAAAFNSWLRHVPVADSHRNPTPDELRRGRPAEF